MEAVEAREKAEQGKTKEQKEQDQAEVCPCTLPHTHTSLHHCYADLACGRCWDAGAKRLLQYRLATYGKHAHQTPTAAAALCKLIQQLPSACLSQTNTYANVGHDYHRKLPTCDLTPTTSWLPGAQDSALLVLVAGAIACRPCSLAASFS